MGDLIFFIIWIPAAIFNIVMLVEATDLNNMEFVSAEFFCFLLFSFMGILGGPLATLVLGSFGLFSKNSSILNGW